VVARAVDQVAVKRLYELKHRHQKPGTLVAASIDQLVTLGIPRRYLTAVEQYWPGAISVVIPSGLKLEYLDSGKHSLAIRIPDHADLLRLLEQTGPLLTSSANMPGEPPANTIAEAREYFGDRVDLYQDGGDLSGHAPSTVIRIIDDAIEVLRAGAVKINENGRINSDI
jgi:tRNA threonylcarbamoyl adenosine modification protein (Sua5/YciO/YrdC/YwlC family)